nr:M13 family metallopeptidase [Polymorphobacter multimanifer]
MMMRMALVGCSVLALMLPSAGFAADGAVASGKAAIGSFGFDVAGMDRSVTAGQDWGRFANGGYMDRLEIPADQTRTGMFNVLRDLSQERTRTIIETVTAEGGPAGSEARKIADFYATFVDEAAIEARGMTPVAPLLAEIAAIDDRAALVRMMALLTRDGVSMPLRLGVVADAKNPDVHVVSLGQGGLGLPDRDYYLDQKSTRFAEARTKYVAHVATMLTLAGVAGATDAAARAQAIYALESALAEVQWSRVELRQREKTWNPVARTALAERYPGIDWAAMLGAVGLNEQPRLTVGQPSAVTATAAMLARGDLGVWKDYLALRAIEAAAPYLSKAFVEANFAFRGKVLGGQPEDQPRWKKGVDLTSAALGEAVGKRYVAAYFPPDAKAKADEMVKNIIAAMDRRLAGLDWMEPATRVAARDKLASFTAKIGYPDKWRDYSGLEVVKGDLWGNVVRSERHEFQRQVNKIGRPVDRSEWGMTPMTVNAYARPNWNEIVFPAAILQAPFFDPAADEAVNYGGIGAVIGHEISHHFDDQGRKYDKQGKLIDWWTAQDVTRFKALTDKVVAQYGAYEPLPGSKVNGELTLGENIADLAGMTVAFDAWKRSLDGKPSPAIDGFSGEQRFFLGFAQVWRSKYRDAALLQQLVTDPHTPGHFRPYVVRNHDAWYAAFGAKPGEAYYLAPDARLRVW